MAALKDVGDGVRLAPLWWRLGLDQTASRFQRSVYDDEPGDDGELVAVPCIWEMPDHF